MKKLLTWGGVSLITSALLDPVIYGTLEKPIPWVRDVLMLAGGVLCFYLLFKYHDSL